MESDLPRLLSLPKLAVLALAMSATLSLASAAPAQAAASGFSGDWSVTWCDKTAPQTHAQSACGGFIVTLVQSGDRICGSYDGARVRLAQIDEGGARAIRGAVVGRVAIMTAESARSGDLYLIRATLRGNALHWRMLDTVKEADGDIDVIAFDDTLTRRKSKERSERSLEIVSACAQPAPTPAQ